jgi:hypothetical protein
MSKAVIKRRSFKCIHAAEAFFNRLEITKSIERDDEGNIIVRFEPNCLHAMDSTPKSAPSWCAEITAGKSYELVSEGPFGYTILDNSGRKAHVCRNTMREVRMPLSISPEFKMVKGAFK